MQVFISSSRVEAGVEPRRLLEVLESEYGHGNVFIDEASLSGGEDWGREINSKLASSDSLVVVFGPPSTQRIHGGAPSQSPRIQRLVVSPSKRQSLEVKGAEITHHRLHDQWEPKSISVEESSGKEIVFDLGSKGRAAVPIHDLLEVVWHKLDKQPESTDLMQGDTLKPLKIVDWTDAGGMTSVYELKSFCRLLDNGRPTGNVTLLFTNYNEEVGRDQGNAESAALLTLGSLQPETSTLEKELGDREDPSDSAQSSAIAHPQILPPAEHTRRVPLLSRIIESETLLSNFLVASVRISIFIFAATMVCLCPLLLGSLGLINLPNFFPDPTFSSKVVLPSLFIGIGVMLMLNSVGLVGIRKWLEAQAAQEVSLQYQRLDN
jgi:hypothetical protein